MSVTFSYADRKPSIEGKQSLKKFIERLFAREGVELNNLSYVFCSDDYLLDINRQFLRHDYYTDIITFDLRSNHADPVTGEIYISADRVKDNATEHKTDPKEELLRVIFHGSLHLCGFNDKTKREKSMMRQKEDEYLRLYIDQNTSST